MTMMTAELLFNSVFRYFGIPEDIVSNRGPKPPITNLDRRSVCQQETSDCVLPCKKLSHRYVGPFTILRQINPVTFKLQLPPQYKIHSTFHVSLLKPYHPPVSPSTEPGPNEEPPLPLILEDGTIYEVKKLLDSQRRGGQLEYLVDWEGYGPEERSWVPRNDILDPTLLEEFHSTHPKRPAPRGRDRPPRRRGPRTSGAGRGEGGNVTDRPGSHISQSQHTPSPEY